MTVIIVDDSELIGQRLAAPYSGASPPLALKQMNLRVPQAAGVYGLRLNDGFITYPKGGHRHFLYRAVKELKKATDGTSADTGQ